MSDTKQRSPSTMQAIHSNSDDDNSHIDSDESEDQVDGMTDDINDEDSLESEYSYCLSEDEDDTLVAKEVVAAATVNISTGRAKRKGKCRWRSYLIVPTISMGGNGCSNILA